MAILTEAAQDQATRAIVFHESVDAIEAMFIEALDRHLPAVLEHSELSDSIRADNIEAFREGIARAIISARSLVEGFNVPSADLGVIAASSGSVRQRIQSLGRMLRRKPGGGTARIVVLYVADTEDEAIYEKADWAGVIGANANRYFRWNPDADAGPWSAALTETGEPPRAYLPSSWDIDVAKVKRGAPYPGRSDGIDVRVDQQGNLRDATDRLLEAPRDLVEAILSINPLRRGRITPAGHLIARADGRASTGPDWRYLGRSDANPGPDHLPVVRLRVRHASGRRVIARIDEGTRAERFAIGPETGGSPEGGQARDTLLAWIGDLASQRGHRIQEIGWDGHSGYWVELEGSRISYPGTLPPLEFTA